MIDPASGTPLYQQVAADLRSRIMSGELPVGMQLETHRKLVERYGVSIITINKALSGLVSEGVLHSRVGRGTFVAVRPTPVEPVRRTEALLGFVLRDLNSPFFSLVAHAALERADAAGFGLVLSSSANRLDREEEQIKRLLELGCDGLVIVSMARTYRPTPAIRELHERGIPYVMVSYTEGDHVPFIGLDLDHAGYLVGRHLVALGRRTFGYIADKFGSALAEAREGGYRRALHEQGMHVDPAFAFEYPFEGEWNDYRSGYTVGQHVATLPRKPEAMFAFNDIGAIGFIDALLDAGIRVPDDIAVVGIDDIELASRARVSLTTIRQPVDRIGAMAVEYLLARLRGERPHNRQLLTPELIVRRSCGAALEEPPRSAAGRPQGLRSRADRAAAGISEL